MESHTSCPHSALEKCVINKKVNFRFQLYQNRGEICVNYYQVYLLLFD